MVAPQAYISWRHEHLIMNSLTSRTHTHNEWVGLACLALDRRNKFLNFPLFSSFCFSFDRQRLCVYIGTGTVASLQFRNDSNQLFFQVLSSSSSSVFRLAHKCLEKSKLWMRICSESIVWLAECCCGSGKRQIQLNFYSNAFSIWKCHSKSDTKQCGQNTLKSIRYTLSVCPANFIYL